MNSELTPWKSRLQSSLEQMRRDFDETVGGWFGEGAGGLRPFSPQTNIAETENQYEVTVDLPGMRPEEVKVELVGNSLMISGERKHESETKEKTFHRVERSYGMFRRSFPLDQSVEAEQINARFASGVLTITVPKSQSALPRQIQVQEG
jgi:HSP20 family protein